MPRADGVLAESGNGGAFAAAPRSIVPPPSARGLRPGFGDWWRAEHGPEKRTILVSEYSDCRPRAERKAPQRTANNNLNRETQLRFVGIDLGLRAKHRAAVFDGVEPRGRPFAVEVSREGFDALLERATRGTEGPVNIVIEPTGLAWLPIAAHLTAAGHRVFVPKPQKVSDLRKFYKKHTKSDAVDAGVLARLPQVDPLGVHELVLPTAEEMTLRRLVKRYDRLMSEVADQKRRIHALMVMVNPALMDALGGDKFGRAAVAFLRTYADPEKVIKLGMKRLQKFWDSKARRTDDPERVPRVFEACRRTAELYRELRDSGRLPFDYDEVQQELEFELDRMERAGQDAKQLEKRIQKIYRRMDPQRTLEKICGIGEVIAPAIHALVGDIERFPNGNKFIGYTGLCPRKNQTGTSDTPMPITKTGQRLLKKYFYLAADVARQWDPELAAYYARRYAKGDHHNRIVIALARKLAWRAYAVLKRWVQAQREQSAAAVDSISYVLRAPDGRQVDKHEARNLIVDKLARDVVAPERATRERSRKSGGAGAGRNMSGRRDDATRTGLDASAKATASTTTSSATTTAVAGVEPSPRPVEELAQDLRKPRGKNRPSRQNKVIDPA